MNTIRFLSPRPLTIVLVSLSLAPLAATDQTLDPPELPWNPGEGPTFHRVVFDTDRFLAVGANGTVAVSMDGNRWDLRESGSRVDLRAAVHGPDGWWLAGDNGTLLTSTDTVRWKLQEIPIQDDLLDLVYSRCQFIAVGSSGAILTSDDGVTWTRRKSGASVELRRVVDVGAFFLAGGANQTLLKSNDGIRWFPYWGGRSLGVRDLVIADGHMLALGCCGGGVYRSRPDGPWYHSAIPGKPALNAAAIGAGRMVVAGAHGGILSALLDGTDLLWRPANSGTSRAFFGVAYGKGRWVAVGSAGTLFVSRDGVHWTSAIRTLSRR